jgi:hypothetical protein
MLPILRERKPVPSTLSTASGSLAGHLNAESIHRNEMMLRQKEHELEIRLATESSRLQAEFERQREIDKYQHELKIIEIRREVELNVENFKAQTTAEAEQQLRELHREATNEIAKQRIEAERTRREALEEIQRRDSLITPETHDLASKIEGEAQRKIKAAEDKCAELRTQSRS